MKSIKNKLKNVSPWYILILVLIGFAFTQYNLRIYGIVHWHISPARLDLDQCIKEKELADAKSNSTAVVAGKNSYSRLANASKTLMQLTGICKLIGLLNLLLSISCFFLKPRWVGFISLPIGMYSANLAMTLM